MDKDPIILSAKVDIPSEGEKLSPEALESAAEQSKGKIVFAGFDYSKPIGKVIGAKIENGDLIADIELSRQEMSLSIAYRVNKSEMRDGIRTILEVDLVSLGVSL